MRFNLFLICTCLVLSCKKHSSYSNIKIIGHAASGLKMPNAVFHDNSEEAIEMALETSGCDGVEIDIQLSASGKFWLFHNPGLSGETNETGCIGSKNDLELNATRYKSIHKEKLLSLANLPFEKLKGKTLMLDLRQYDYCKEQEIAVQPVLDQLASITQFYDGNIEIMVLLSTSGWFGFFADSPFQVIYAGAGFDYSHTVLEENAFDGMMLKNSEISAEQVKLVKSEGKKVIIFEVRSPKGIRSALKKQPDYLVTDDLRATIIEKY